MKYKEEEHTQCFYSIRINNPKESKEIQEILFSIGLKWASGETKVLYQDENVMSGIFIIKSDLSIVRTKGYNEWIEAKEDVEEEITIKQLRDKDFQMKLKKMLILSRLEDGKN